MTQAFFYILIYHQFYNQPEKSIIIYFAEKW